MIAVTGATGHLGQLAVAELIKQGTKPQDIVAVVRNRTKAQNLSSQGVTVREGDYNSQESLEKAFQGVQKLLFISGSEIGQRVAQHTKVVNAAKNAKVQFIAYTSILKADTSKMLLAKEHLATEDLIKNSGISYTLLRNGWYIENYTEQFANYLQSGVIAGSAQNGKISAASRADYAAAAAAVILGKGQKNATYELGGDAFTMTELAAVAARVSGKKIEYKDMPVGDYIKLLESFGLPQAFAEILGDSDVGIVRGDLFTESKDLKQLLGRSLTSLETAAQKAIS